MGSPPSHEPLFSPPPAGGENGTGRRSRGALPPRPPSPGLKRQLSGGALSGKAASVEPMGVTIKIATPVMAPAARHQTRRPRRQVRDQAAAEEAAVAPPVCAEDVPAVASPGARVLDFSSPPSESKKAAPMKEVTVAAVPHASSSVLGFFSPRPKGGGAPAVSAAPEVIAAVAETEKAQLQAVLDAKTETAAALTQLAAERASRVAAQHDAAMAASRAEAAERVAADAKCETEKATQLALRLQCDLDVAKQHMRDAVEEAAASRAALVHKQVEVENAAFACAEAQAEAAEAATMRQAACQLRARLHALITSFGGTTAPCTSDAMSDALAALEALARVLPTAAAPAPAVTSAQPRVSAQSAAKKSLQAADVKAILQAPFNSRGRSNAPGASTPASSAVKPSRQQQQQQQHRSGGLRMERSAPCLSYRQVDEDDESEMPPLTPGAPMSAVKARRALGALNLDALDLRGATPHKAAGGNVRTPGAAAQQENEALSAVTPKSALRMLAGAARVELLPGSRTAKELARAQEGEKPKAEWSTRW